MKQTLLLIIALFIGIGNVNAQDDTNDATWEETIQFINSKSDYYSSMTDREFKSFIIKNNTLIIYRKHDDKPHVKADLTKLSSSYILGTSMYPKASIGLVFTGNYVYPDDCCSPADQINIQVLDKEMRERFYKSTQHLAYLATKKRNELKKASGDKF